MDSVLVVLSFHRVGEINRSSSGDSDDVIS